MLEFKDVSKSFNGPRGKVLAMEKVSFSVSSGEIVSVQGPSGCGKSTMLLSAGGLQAPSSGTVEIEGKDPYALSANARAGFRSKQIGFVFQQFHLLPYLSVRDNILSPSVARSCSGAGKKADELIERFQLEHRRGHRPAQLSTGERQRTALARALLLSPRLLLADEPTGNLDGENSKIVLCHLKDFAEAGGAVMIVTHDPNITDYATRNLFMREGSLVQEGEAMHGKL